MVFCSLALCEGKLPPTINLQNPDPQCDLNYLAGTAETAQVGYAMNLSFGFGGHNVCQLIGRVTDPTLRRSLAG
jgi:3-oxoacyl-[acyl-carrier-protein] synthase II